MILGHGVDLVKVDRIARSIDRFQDRFLQRVFTEGERRYSGQSRRRDEHLAARFAAKEAVLKALGTGWSQGVSWTDIEVVSQASGRPALALHGRAADVARQMGVKWWHLSLTHTDGLAMASVIAEG